MPELAPAPLTRAALRDALAYLLDEVAMLRVPLARLPERLQTEAPAPGVPSLCATYAGLAVRDAARAAALATNAPWPAEDAPLGDAPEADALPPDALLDRVTDARTALLAAVDGLSDEAFAAAAAPLHAAVLADAARLRTLAEHLFDARGLGG